MNRRPTEELDTFETALLDELQVFVRETVADAPAHRTSVRSPWWRRRRWQASVAAVAASTLATALLLPTPAFAVTGRNDGQVKVRVNRLEGAERLEQALQKRGIAADITYLPANKQCAPERYAEVRTPGLSLTVGTERFEVVIPPGAVGDDDTFVLSAAVEPLPDGLRTVVDFGIAHGPVGSCRVVDAP